jgi:hypothetical protein
VISSTTRAILFSGVLLALAATSWGQAGIRWKFTEPVGTPLTEVAGWSTWSENFADSYCTGDGAFRVRRNQNTPSNSFARLPSTERELWLHVRVRAWELSGQAFETVRFGFSHTDDPKSPMVTAQLKLERTADGMSLSGEALPATMLLANVPSQRIAGPRSDEPLDLLLRFDPGSRLYEIFYRLGSAEWLTLGTGETSNRRNAAFVRLNFAGPFGSNGAERFDLEEVTVTAVDPRP